MKKEYADNLVTFLNKRNLTPIINQVTINDRLMYRVEIGPLKTEIDAKKLSAYLPENIHKDSRIHRLIVGLQK